VYHEGGAQFRIRKYGDKYFIKLTEEYNQSDSAEIKILDNGTRLELWNEKYIKLEDRNTIAEKTIFAGTYVLGDKEVTISASGNISGLDSVSRISVENDYIGPGMDLDLIYLQIGNRGNVNHTFNFSEDTLHIYSVYCNETDENGGCLDTKRGELLWTLVKK